MFWTEPVNSQTASQQESVPTALPSPMPRTTIVQLAALTLAGLLHQVPALLHSVAVWFARF